MLPVHLNPLCSLARNGLLFAFSVWFYLGVSAADTAVVKHTFDVPAGAAEDSLKLFSQQSGRRTDIASL